jgi:hypothetical protein
VNYSVTPGFKTRRIKDARRMNKICIFTKLMREKFTYPEENPQTIKA